MTMAQSCSRSENGAQPCDDPCGAHSSVRVNMQGCCKMGETSGLLLGCNQSVSSTGNVVCSCMKAHIDFQHEVLEGVRQSALLDPQDTTGKQIVSLLQNL